MKVIVLEHVTRTPLVEWRGPAPFYFLKLETAEANAVLGTVRDLTYGWGVIPAIVGIGKEVFETSIFPREGTLFVPIKKDIRLKAGIELGQFVEATLTFVTK